MRLCLSKHDDNIKEMPMEASLLRIKGKSICCAHRRGMGHAGNGRRWRAVLTRHVGVKDAFKALVELRKI